MTHPNGGRKRPRPLARTTRRALIEAVEPRLLLCALHENGGNSVHVTFWDNSNTPLDLHVNPIEPTGIVGPTLDLQTPAAPALFTPITNWDTAANGLPILNSLPGAPTAVYLDFDGDTGSSTTAYSEDADLTTYNITEQTNIVEAWRQISAYFAMFDTNVTTQFTSLPKAWDIIGNNAGGATGGYAYVGTFPNTAPEAFNAASNARTRESGMAHEIGHVFGLQHQSSYDNLGVKINEYISQVDSLHGAIMGVDYAGNVHKWFIGHSATGVTSLQDDMAVISGKIKAKEATGGDGYRPDDFGNTIANASALTDNGSGFQFASGIIERRTDVDTFSFNASGGSVALAAVPDSPSGVDLKLEIYDSNGTLVAAKDGATNDQQMTLTLPAGTYYAQISSHGDYGDQGMYDFSVRAIPAGWTSADIGTVGLAGYAEFDPTTSTFTNAGAGSAVSGTADSFHYTYQTLNGDGEIIARVTQNQNTSASAKVGLEIRDGLTNNAKHAAITLTPTGGAQFIYRSGLGSTATTIGGSTSALPLWLRLVRAGNVFTAYTSTDGATWNQVSQATITMNAAVSVGLLTSSLTTSKLDLGKIDSVTITGDTTPVAPIYNALPAPTDLVVTPAPTGTGLSLAWTDVVDSTGFNVLRSSDGITYTQIGTTAVGITTYTDANPGTWMRYFYKVAARDATGASAPSTVVSAVPRPPAPTGLALHTTTNTTSTLVLDWKDVSGDAGYRIERSADAGVTWSTLSTVGINVPSYNNNSLPAGTTYSYRVFTLSAAGDSAPSTIIIGASRLPAVTGAAFDTIASNSITLHWTDIAGETGYRIDRSLDGATWSTITSSVPANTTTYTDTTVASLKEYYYRVYGITAQALSLDPAGYIFAATPSATALLPTPWVAADIGTIYGKGASGYSGGTYTLISSGSDITGTADSFRYTYQSLPGNGQIIARIATLENTDANAKAGVMIRASTAAGAAYLGVFLTPGAGLMLQTRSSIGATTTVTAGPTTVVAPYWVKVVRSGNTLSGYYSADGVNWTQVGANLTLSLGTSGLIGLATTSRSTTLLSTATVTNVTTNLAPTIATPAAATAATNQNTTNLSALGADDQGEANLTYTWSATTIPSGAAAPTFSANASNTAKNTTATFFKSGTYTFLATITDASGLSVTSSATLFVTLAVPPTIVNAAAANPNPVVNTNNTALSALGDDDQGEAALRYTWTTTTLPAGATAPTFTANNSNAAKNNTATFYQSGAYQFLVTITDGSGLSITSSVNVDVTLPSPPTIATPASATPNPVIDANTAALSVLGADDQGEPNLTYTWSISSIPIGALSPTFSTNASNSAKDTIATFYKSGTYGFLVTITDANGLSTTSSTSVDVSLPVAPTIAIPAAADPNPAVNSNTANLSVLGADDRGEANLTYTWSLTTIPDAAAAPTFSVNGTNAAKNTIATFANSGTYQFLVTVTDAAGLSVTSSVSVDVTLPAAVPPTVATPAAATPNPVTSGNTANLSVLGADDQGEPSLTYAWTTTALPDGATAPTFSVNNTNAAKNTTVTFAQPGDYTFRVTITDAGGLSVTSSIDVKFPAPPPQVTAINYDFHNHLSVTFSKDVSASLGVEDLTVQPMVGDGPSLSPTDMTWDAASNTATFTFATDFADGDYQVAISTSGVYDADNVHLAYNSAYTFFAMAGDITRDRTVDFNDLVILAQNYNATGGKTHATGDLTGDGNVDFNDLVILAQHYNTTLPTAPVATPAELPAPVVAATPTPAPVATTTTATPPTPTATKTPTTKIAAPKTPTSKPKALPPAPHVPPAPTIPTPKFSNTRINVATETTSDDILRKSPKPRPVITPPIRKGH